MPVAALVLVGLLLIVLGIFAAGSLPLIALGVISLIAAGVLDAMARRRR
jgi:hypothetical protein